MYVNIDSAIKALKNCTNETDRQVAKWLEKLQYIENIILKWNADGYNDEDTGIPADEILEAIFNACTDNGFDIPIDDDFREGYDKGYNKAIDDFVARLKKECREYYIDSDPYFGGIKDSILFEDEIEEIAEQLKAGK